MNETESMFESFQLAVFTYLFHYTKLSNNLNKSLGAFYGFKNSQFHITTVLSLEYGTYSNICGERCKIPVVIFF